MAVNAFDLQVVVEAIDRLTEPMRRMTGQVKHFTAATEKAAALREMSGTFMKVGLGAIALGGGMAYALKSLVDPAIEAEGSLAHIAGAMGNATDSAKHLAEADAAMIQLSKTQVGSIESLRTAYYDGISTNLDYKQSLAAVTMAQSLSVATAQTVDDVQTNLAPSTRLLGTMFQNFGDKTKDAVPQMKMYADQLAVMQSSQAFHSLDEVNEALKYAAPLTTVARIGITQMNTALSLLSAGGKHGPEAGTAYVEFVSALLEHGKAASYAVRDVAGNLDLHASVNKLAAATANMGGVQRTQFLNELGFHERSIQGLGILIGKTNEWDATYKRLSNSQGEAARLAAIRQQAADFQLALAGQNWDDLKEAIGKAMLPLINNYLPRVTASLQRMETWVENHQGFVKLALKIAAVAAATSLAGGATALFLGGLGDVASYVPKIMKLLNPYKWLEAAQKAAATAQWALNAAMDANPAVWAAAALIALAFAAYEIYEHWAGIKKFFVDLWTSVSSYVSTKVAEAYDWGVNLAKKLGQGIEDGAMWAVHAVEHMAGRMAKFLVGHSPIPEGPLRSLDLTRDIARTLEPSRMMTAIRNVAMVTAVAAPMMIGAGGSASASNAPRGAAPINITVTYNVRASSPEEFIKAARKHADELVKIIDQRMAARARTEF